MRWAIPSAEGTSRAEILRGTFPRPVWRGRGPESVTLAIVPVPEDWVAADEWPAVAEGTFASESPSEEGSSGGLPT